MYPRILDIPLPFDFLGIDSITIYSFGAMVAVAVLTAAWLIRKELDRLYAAGRLPAVRIQVEPENGKRRRSTTQLVSPSALVGTMTVMAIGLGFVGAKIFHILENLGDFFVNPLGMLFSSGGFTFYGGLLVAAVAIALFVRSKGLRVPVMADAVAPSLMLGYGIGRIGCHLAGDGDWGIVSDLSQKPDWIPTWLWAETYPNNILNVTIPEPGAYPTPLYEFFMAAALFGVLWALRDHPFRAGWLFSLYLLLNGAERFLIEKIRVNNTMELLGMTVTQAEVISSLLMLAGIVGLVLTTKRRAPGRTVPQPADSSIASSPA